jgi:uncharacterized protein
MNNNTISLITLNTKGRVDFELSPDLSKYYTKDIKDIENLKVKGYIIDNGTKDYEIYLNITGNMILTSAINGKNVAKSLNIEYNDFVENLVENYKISSNSLDILPVLWENILLEIPIRAVNPDDEFETTSGEGWEIVR